MMYLIKAFLVTGIASCASAAIAAVPTNIDSVVVERPDISPRDARNPPERLYCAVNIPGDSLFTPKSLCSVVFDFSNCFYGTVSTHDIPNASKFATSTANFGIPVVKRPTPSLRKRDAMAEARPVRFISTVTAPPAGTTTVYMPDSTPPVDSDAALPITTLDHGIPALPHELILTQTSPGTTVVTTAVVEATAVTTVTTEAYSSTTLTDPINPTLTTVINAASTTCANNTSIDTSSYLNISTFSASGLPIDTSSVTLAFNSTVASLLTSAMGRTNTMVSATRSSSGITTSTGKSTMPLPSEPVNPASSTITLGSQAGPPIAASTIDDGGSKMFTMMLVGIGTCLVLALLL